METTEWKSETTLNISEYIGSIEAHLQETKNTLKRLIKEKKASVCNMGNDVVVNGKKSNSKKRFNREIKLRLRCFDNEFKYCFWASSGANFFTSPRSKIRFEIEADMVLFFGFLNALISDWNRTSKFASAELWLMWSATSDNEAYVSVNPALNANWFKLIPLGSEYENFETCRLNFSGGYSKLLANSCSCWNWKY